MNELEKWQQDTLIDLHKEDYKKVLDAYYFNQANMDKLIITILFAEIGFIVLHLAEFMHALSGALQLTKFYAMSWCIMPIVVGAIGVGLAFWSYKCSSKLLSFEKDRIILDIEYILGLDEKDSERMKRLSHRYEKTGFITDVLNWFIYASLFITTISVMLGCLIRAVP